jgi:hypothetical protein
VTRVPHRGAPSHEHNLKVVAAGGGDAFAAGLKESQLAHHAHYVFLVARTQYNARVFDHVASPTSMVINSICSEWEIWVSVPHGTREE